MEVIEETNASGPSATRYHTDIGQLDESSHYGRLALMVGQGKQVLELGCSTGFFSSALSKQFNCTVTGIELDPLAAQEAKQYCQRVIVADLDDTNVLQTFHDASFDVVVCSDVLEHLRNPGQLLLEIRRLLKPDGYIVASIPHVGHGSIRLSLLGGQFPYRSMGLLDETHLRFFDRMELEQLFVKSGYELYEVHRNRWSIMDNEIGSRVGSFPNEIISAIESDSEAETYQFIVKARLQPRSEAGNGVLSEKEGNNKATVDCVIFETPSQPLNDKVISYLAGLNVAKLSVRYYLVRLNSVIPAPVDTLPVEHFEFGNHDFSTFRFVSCGDFDKTAEVTTDVIAEGLNKGVVLNKLIPECRASFVFVTDSQNLPTTDCIALLVNHAYGDEACGIAAASPEIYRTGQPYRAEGGIISWTPFTSVLLRKSAFEKISGVNTCLSGQEQEVDFCWRLWQSGNSIVQVKKARFFSFGISSSSSHLQEYKRLKDAAQLRLAWGSWRVVAGFLKNSILAAKGVSLVEKASLLLASPVMLLNSLSRRSMNRKGANATDSQGMIGFYGEGRRFYGISPD
ncbi:MAG: class I SAM-dependent methyltransferase [Candidatus Obscuribacterales bacterium]|nr:class I SAM-dependent methyltransferase [Candidatus Obscuribacterales bacterium]